MIPSYEILRESNIRMSSRYAVQKSSKNGRRWKWAGALVSPKVMTRDSKRNGSGRQSSTFLLCVVGGTDVGTGQAHEIFLDERQWIPVFDGRFVEASVIDVQAEGAIRLDEQDRGCSWMSGGRNPRSGSLPATISRFLTRCGTSSRAARRVV